MRLCLLHGYLLEGSGSNLWTRAIVQALCRRGETVHLVSQECDPQAYDFISEAHVYGADGSVQTILSREVDYDGRCVLHRPQIGEVLPVYVWDRYEDFSEVVPMVQLPDVAIADYLDRNVRVVTRIAEEHRIDVLHANHAVLMSVVAERVGRATGIPYAIMPHGSAIEYAVRPDARFQRLAEGAFANASRIFVIGPEIRDRVQRMLRRVPNLGSKMTELNLGADTNLFEPLSRERRRSNVTSLSDVLADVPRGKTREQSEALRAELSRRGSHDEARRALATTGDYDAKSPDADLEGRLRAVDWESDPIVLFVGRLIASKGPQSVLAALPLILRRYPTARLLVVGHGPLREGLEALLWALEHGERGLVHDLVTAGEALEGGPKRAFRELQCFFEELTKRGEIDAYFESARAHVRPERVVFGGYLTHRELRFLFPCCDVAVFPSVVAEAGPLVFLEAIASGVFPLGTYFAGMGATIDAVGRGLPAEDARWMRLDPDEHRTVEAIAQGVAGALGLAGKHRDTLRRLAVERYDWRSVAARFWSALEDLATS